MWGGVRNDHFLSPYYILHILFHRTPVKVLRGFILQVGKLSVSLLVECEFPMVIQLIGRIGIQNSDSKTHALIHFLFPGHLFEKNTKWQSSVCLSMLILVIPELWLIEFGFLKYY